MTRFQAIEAQGRINGVEGLEMIGGNAARALEPELSCIGALHSPETGIIDAHAYMLALRGDLEDAGGAIAFNTKVARAARKDGQWQVGFGEGEAFAFDALVNCAGLGAQAAARAWRITRRLVCRAWSWPRAIISPSPGGRCSSA